MKLIYLLLLLLSIILFSCGYPDIDSVPEFKDILLSEDEIREYCSNRYSDINDIDICIKNYKSKNEL